MVLLILIAVRRVFMIVLAIFVAFNKKVKKVPPQGSPLVDAAKTLAIGAREGSLEKAKPTSLQANGKLDKYAFASSPGYTDLYVAQVKSGLLACKVRHKSPTTFPFH